MARIFQPGFLGDPLLNIEFIAVTNPDHPLHQVEHPLGYEDFKASSSTGGQWTPAHAIFDSGWLGADQRLTLASIGTSIEAACRGLGYAWYPRLKVQHHLDTGRLKTA